jgi:hypothetical protein
VSLETRPEVRSMRYKFRLEFIIYLQSVWLFSESIAVSEVVFSEYCRQFGIGIEVFTNSSFFTNIGTFISMKVTDVRENHQAIKNGQASDTGNIGHTRHRSQFGGFHRELRLVRWFSQNIALNSVLFADYCSQFSDFFRVLRVPSTNKINH